MPVLLTTAEEYDTWLTATVQEALMLHRSWPDVAEVVVAQGMKPNGRCRPRRMPATGAHPNGGQHW